MFLEPSLTKVEVKLERLDLKSHKEVEVVETDY